MNNLEIYHSLELTKARKILATVVGAYLGLYGLYEGILLALEDTYSFNFYLALIALVLGAIMVLTIVLSKPKFLLRINAESIFINMPNIKSTYSAEWIAIKEIGIGISSLKFSETDGKDYTVNVDDLKYSDLKELKSTIVEVCESKKIPYKND